MTIDMPPSDDARPSMSTFAGRVVAQKYELLRLLGQGGMGAVFEAKHRETLKRVAVKLLTTTDFGQSDAVRRFFREARASSVIESDHIVQIYDSGVDPELGAPYMVMELLRGEDLEQLVDRVGVLPPEVAVKVVMQAAAGLAKAHAAGIVHRDIKPANLFLTQRDSGEILVKLLDFGIAKVKQESLTDTQSNGLTRTGTMLGTPLYMSPEQARGQTDIDAKSDVWSLGVVLYELVSGSLPYGSVETLGDLIVAIITAEIPPVQESAPWVPQELAMVIARALSRDRSQRYANAAELSQALAVLVTDGARLVPEMLAPLSSERRGTVAARAVTQVTSGAVTRTGFARTDAKPGAPSRTPWFLLVAVVLLAGAGIAGLLVLRVARKEAVSVSPPASAPAESKRFSLSVPNRVSARVNGKAAVIIDGKVELEGPPGATLGIELTRGEERIERVVVVSEAGLVPSSLEWPEPAVTPAPSSASSQARPSRPSGPLVPAAKAKPAPSEKSTPAKPSTPPGIDTSDKDFQ